MQPLSTEDLARLRSRLISRQTELRDAIGEQQQGQSRVEASIEERDLLERDQRDAAALRDVAQTTVDTESLELVEVAMALERIECGSYGLCADCGAVIPKERLFAQPVATRCLTCQAGAERSQSAAIPTRKAGSL